MDDQEKTICEKIAGFWGIFKRATCKKVINFATKIHIYRGKNIVASSQSSLRSRRPLLRSRLAGSQDKKAEERMKGE